MLQVADLQFDSNSGTVIRDGKELALSRLNYALLKALITRAPALVSVDQLLDDVWPGVVVNEETVRQRVKLLRKALGDDSANPRYIEVVRGRGYRLIPVVVESTKSTGQSTQRRLRPVVWIAAVGVLAGLAYVTIDVPGTTPETLAEAVELPESQAIDDQPVRLAVLPLAEPQDVSNEFLWFADGMHDELLTRLSKISELQVRPRSSSARFSLSDSSHSDIAQALEVDWLLEGTVRRSDDAIRVNVRLIDPFANETSWAQSYDNDLSLGNVFEIQSDIAIQVAEAIRGELSANERAQIVLRDTDSLDAYDAQLLGRFHVFRGTEEDIRIAIRQFRTATGIDPGYVRAWEGLGWAHVMSGLTHGWRSPRESLRDAMEAVKSGLAVNPDDAELQNLEASIRLFEGGDIDSARQVFERLAQVDNPSPSVLINLAFTQSLQRDFDFAAETIAVMTERFPFDAPVLLQAAWLNRAAGKPQSTIDFAEQALRYDPEMRDARLALAWGYFDSGEYEQAFEKFSELGVYAGRIMSLSRLGRIEEARTVFAGLNEAASGNYVHPYVYVLAYLGLGDDDSVRRAINAALQDGGRESLWMTIDPEVARFMRVSP